MLVYICRFNAIFATQLFCFVRFSICFALFLVTNDFVCQTVPINVVYLFIFVSFTVAVWIHVIFHRYINHINGKNALRHSTTSSTRSAPTRTSNYSRRSYDLQDAQADATREQRTQVLLGTMAGCEIVCIGPLMVLR